MPRALQRESTRGRAAAQYEGAPVKRKKVQRRRLFTWKQRLDRRTENVREAARAIKAGHAEAHPIIIEKGFHGPLNVPPEELQELGRTFGESLRGSAIRRFKSLGKRKKKVPRMATPTGQDKFAALFGQ
ncbi:MAG: hypothetical protein V3W37_00960 [Candidatus Binatia bacterium]